VGVDSEAGADDFEFQYQIPISPISRRLIVGPEMDRSLIEQYRRLAATLHHAQLRTGNHTVMIASAIEAEGKTLTATNVALTLSHSYRRRVLLVDADLRRPSIHTLFSLDNRIGLRDMLKRSGPDGNLPVQQVSSMLWVMTAGRPDPDPMSGLVSDTMRQLLVEAAEQFDWVVIDTPPVALLPDANLLAAMVDAALLVVSASTTPYPLVARAIEAIGASRILGVVLNRADPSEAKAGYGDYNYSDNYYAAKRSPKPRRRFHFGLAPRT
jgi:receptor protein-tyrosine kinase